jgi:Fe-S cluster biogenesis protein NfuA
LRNAVQRRSGTFYETVNVKINIREDTMKEKIQAVIDKIRPMLQADGGDVELVDVVDGVVTVRLQGACAGCPMSQMTLKNGIERYLKKEIPEVKSVERVD